MSSISPTTTSAIPQQLTPADFFKKADTDGSGGISKTELSSMMKNSPPPPPPPAGGVSGNSKAPSIEEVFSAADTNEDGEISEAENEAQMEKLAKNGPEKPESMSGSSDAFDQFAKALQASTLSKDDLSTLLNQWVAQLKEKGSATTLFSAQA